MKHLDDQVGCVDWLEVLRAKLEKMIAEKPKQALLRGRESTVVGVLTGAILFEDTDDPAEVCLCCREALRRLDGMSRGHCPIMDDDEAVRGYLMRTFMYARDRIAP